MKSSFLYMKFGCCPYTKFNSTFSIPTSDAQFARDGGTDFPYPIFETERRYPDFLEKCPNCVHLRLEFLI